MTIHIITYCSKLTHGGRQVYTSLFPWPGVRLCRNAPTLEILDLPLNDILIQIATLVFQLIPDDIFRPTSLNYEGPNQT